MPAPTTPPADGQQGNDGGETPPTPPQGTPPATPPEKTFTQAELDAIIGERLKRAAPADYDEAKRKAAAFDAQEEAGRTELEKANAKAEKAEQKAKDAEARATDVLRRTSILAQAAAQNAVDPEAVVILLAADPSVTVDADGITVKGAKEAVAKLLKEKGYLVKNSGTPSSSGGGEFGGQDTKTLDQKISEAEAKGDWSTSRRLKLQRSFGNAGPGGTTK